MTLKDVNVLIDGYNLQLQQGTGVKAYGQTLIDALGTLGAKVAVLLSSGASRGMTSDPILNEVLFFDNHERKTSHLGLIPEGLKAATRL